LAFSVGIFPLVLLAAALGTVFRASHALVAFGVSFVPASVLVLSNIMGRQLAHNAATASLGLAVIWGTVVAVSVLAGGALSRRIWR
jgi:hypothetical protein